MARSYKRGEHVECRHKGEWFPGVYLLHLPAPSDNYQQHYAAVFDVPGATQPAATWHCEDDIRPAPVTLQQPPKAGPPKTDIEAVWDIVRRHLGSPSVVNVGAQLITALGRLEA